MGIDGNRLGRVIDHAIEKFVQLILETRKGYNQYAFLYNAPGDDSVPCKKDRIVIIKIDGTGKFVAVGMLNESQGAKPGEKIFYGRNADGKIVSTLKMLNDGFIELDADSDIKITAKKTIAIKAMDKITLDCGGSTIVIDSSGITMNGEKINLN